MRTYRVKEFIQYLQATIGVSANSDMMYRWLEEAMTEIRSKPWSWNWKIERGVTSPPILETHKFTWVAGQYYVTCAAPMANVDFTHTGRIVKIGDHWYQCTDIGKTSATRIYVSRPLITTQTAATALTFHRDHKFFKTSKVRNVAVGDVPKCARYSSSSLRQYWLLTDVDDLDEGSPYCYQDIVLERIKPPAHPPGYASSGGGSFTNGKYVYFFTKFDVESGLESEPGPSLIVEVTDGNVPVITYSNPAAADVLEETSYKLRLYRSEIILATDPRPRLRLPMFNINERAPTASPFNDINNNAGLLRGKVRYWDGAYAGVRLLPKPDSTERFDVECLSASPGRFHDEDYIKLGPNDEVMQLLRLYISGASKLKGLNATEYQQHLIAFRRQQAHLLGQDREPGNADPGPKNTNNYSVNEYGSGDWVDGLQSPWGQ